MPLERVNNVERGDSLALGVLSVGDCIADDALKEGLEHATGLLVDHGRDTLDTTTASQAADGRLSDTLDVVAKNLPVTLGTALSEALATFSTCKRLSVYYVEKPGSGCWVDIGYYGEDLRPVIVIEVGKKA